LPSGVTSMLYALEELGFWGVNTIQVGDPRRSTYLAMVAGCPTGTIDAIPAVPNRPVF
jgi:hypothetical protein